MSKGLLTNRWKYVCNKCLKYATDHLSEENGKEIPSTGHESIDDNTKDLSTELHELIIKSTDELMKQLEEAKTSLVSDKLNNKIKSLTSFISTNFVQPAVTIDSKIISSNYKDLNHLKNINSKKYTTEREPILNSFLEGIISKNHCHPFLLAVIIEAIYHLENNNLILLHCFLANLVETFISGLKTVTAINGKILPSANDTTYRKWLNENGKEKYVVPNCDLDKFIVNVITLLM